MNDNVAVLSETSFAVYTTVWLPIWNCSVGVLLAVTVAGFPLLSVAVGTVHVTVAYGFPTSVFWLMSLIEATLKTGISLSEF